MDRQERLNHIIRILQDLSLNSMDLKARFPGVSSRTIERDLEQLAQEGRIHQVRRDRSRNPTWETCERAPTIEVRWMNGRTAAAIKLMENCLDCILPSALLDDMQPLFSRADNALKQAHNREYASWLGKIRIKPSIKEGKNAEAASKHLGLLQEALLNNSAISIMRHSASQPMLPVVHPQGLLFSREGVHLVGIEEKGKLPFQLNIHDIADVCILDQPATSPANFDLDSCLAGITGVKSIMETSGV